MKWKERYNLPKVGDMVELIDERKALYINSTEGFYTTGTYNKGDKIKIRKITEGGLYIFSGKGCIYNPKCFKKVLK